ncbi:MAG: TIM barrel protein [candidate division Zixibacteria bacterium]|nr:TIM barrel protein [candidate division Zixibacteria bacterium]
MNPLSLSTAWHHRDFDDGHGLVDKTLDMGFYKMEINFMIREHVFKGIAEESRKGRILITSLHNICPVTPEMEKVEGFVNFFNLTALDNDVREKAVELSEMTLRNASELEARCVVFHLGEVGEGHLRKEEKKLKKEIRREKKEPSEFKAEFDALIKQREEKKAKYIDNLRYSLDYLVPAAEKLGVVVGMENRYYLTQVPDFTEIGMLLKDYDSDYFKFWYDFGHAANNSNIGYEHYLSYLKEYGGSVVGIHIHDCVGLDDHQPPGDGKLDFMAIKDLLPEDTLNVLELNPALNDDDLQRGVEYLRQTGFINEN